jgi:hypothetical protein
VRDPWPGRGSRPLANNELIPMYVASITVSSLDSSSDASAEDGSTAPSSGSAKKPATSARQNGRIGAQ